MSVYVELKSSKDPWESHAFISSGSYIPQIWSNQMSMQMASHTPRPGQVWMAQISGHSGYPNYSPAGTAIASAALSALHHNQSVAVVKGRRLGVSVVHLPTQWDPQVRVQPVIPTAAVTYRSHADITKEDSCLGEMVWGIRRTARQSLLSLRRLVARGLTSLSSMFDPGTT